MKMKNFVYIFLILLVIISLVNSKQFSYEELKEKSFPKKIKYLFIHFFAIIEQYTLYYIMGIRSYDINEPYDFFFCFLFGCFLRIFYLFLKKIIKNLLNIKDDEYVYNEPDNTEKLYEVKKKLNEFSHNLKNMKIGKNEDNNINEINNNINNNEIDKKIKLVNDKLTKLENIVNNLGKNYEEEKNHVQINLKTIEECQKFIIDSLKSKEKEN